MVAPSIWLLASLGGVVGLVLALTGAGGGALAVPLLVLVAGWTVQQAAPAALLAVGLAAAIGAAWALRQGLVRWRAALLIGAAGMGTAPLGVWLAQRVPQTLLLTIFAVFMVFTAWRMLAVKPASASSEATWICISPEGQSRLAWSPACAAVLARVGALSGLLTGLLGIGGGFVIVPALDRRSNLDLRTIQATSLAVIALVALSGLTAALWHGQLQARAAWPFALASVGGLMLGRAFAARVPATLLRSGFAAVAGVVALLLMLRAAGWIT